LDQTGCHTAEKIEGKVSNVAEPVFDVIPEDIEEPHVHDNMKKSSMKKHRSQEREILLQPCEVSSKFWIVISEGYHSIEIKSLFQIRTLKELPYKNNDVEANDNEVESREVL